VAQTRRSPHGNLDTDDQVVGAADFGTQRPTRVKPA
jgi:hypothetical protein